MISEVFNEDCMEGLKRYPDKYFDLAICDPPYGGSCSQSVQVRGLKADLSSTEQPDALVGCSQSTISVARTGGTWTGAAKYRTVTGGIFDNADVASHRSSKPGGNWKNYGGSDIHTWDIAPPPEYFDELARVSKNQIIWGGNYFGLPPTRCFLVWRKLTISENFSMAMCEYAWTSFNDNAKLFEFAPQNKDRFHPTAKPKELYDWILKNYAKEGYKILDTHLGQGKIRLSCWDAGLDFTGFEIDPVYFNLEEEQFANYTAQTRLW